MPGAGLSGCVMPLRTTLNSQGFTQILPSLRREPQFQNSPSALMTGRLGQVGFRAAGAAALIPSFAQEGSGSSLLLIQSSPEGHDAAAQACSRHGRTVLMTSLCRQKVVSRTVPRDTPTPRNQPERGETLWTTHQPRILRRLNPLQPLRLPRPLRRLNPLQPLRLPRPLRRLKHLRLPQKDRTALRLPQQF